MKNKLKIHKRISFIVSTILFLAASDTSHSQWVQTTGPEYGGVVYSFTTSGSNLFAGTEKGGVFQSTDNGTNWKLSSSGLPITSVTALTSVIDILFAGSGTGVFRSVNNGINWTEVNSGLQKYSQVSAFTVSGTTLYAGTEYGVYRSTNLGLNWISQNNGLPSNADIRDLVFLGDILFAGDYNHGVYRSTNNGSWTKMNTGLTDTSISSISVSGTTLFAGTKKGVFRSMNYGTTWQEVLNILNISEIAVLGSSVYAGTSNSGIFRSTNNGITWTSFNSGLKSDLIRSLFVSGSNLFTGVSSVGIFRSNGSSSWVEANTGLTIKSIYSISVSSTNLFAATESKGGVFSSTDNGMKWINIHDGLPDAVCRGLYVSGEYLFACCEDLFRSSNNGLNWTLLLDEQGSAFRVVAGPETNLFASAGDIYRSTNSGLNWTSVSSYDANCLAVSNTNIFAGTSLFLYRSTNNGVNWTQLSGGLPFAAIFNDLAFLGSKLFAATEYGIFLSSNNGTNWISLNSGLTNAEVKTIVSSGTNLFAGTEDGVYRITLNDTSWTKINTGLINTYIITLQCSGSDIFTGNLIGGIWKRPLSEVISIKPISSGVPEGFSLDQNYPNPFNPVTNIKFQIAGTDNVKISIVDILGKVVQTLANERMNPGTYEVQFDGSSFSSGVYFYKLETNGFYEVKKMLLVK